MPLWLKLTQVIAVTTTRAFGSFLVKRLGLFGLSPARRSQYGCDSDARFTRHGQWWPRVSNDEL